MIVRLQQHFRSPPTRLGSLDEVSTYFSQEAGQRVANVGGEAAAVVVATARDLNETGFPELESGVYLLGTGSNGVCETMVCVGALVSALMQVAAWSYRLPPIPLALGTAVAEATPAASGGAADAPVPVRKETLGGSVATSSSRASDELSLEEAMRTPQLYLLAAGCHCLAVSGLPFLMGE